MKEFIRKIVEDYRKEDYTSDEWAIGTMVCVCVILFCIIANW